MTTTKPPLWAANLTQRLLAEAPESMAFWEIMASAIAGERARCARLVRAFGDEADDVTADWLAQKIEDEKL